MGVSRDTFSILAYKTIEKEYRKKKKRRDLEFQGFFFQTTTFQFEKS
jgi:hypothetical protein